MQQYTEQEMKMIEAHIEQQFGPFEQVLHEIVSPDIHVDIILVPPNGERNWTTLITMGMGAARMHMPDELREQQLDRAELLVCLPTDWGDINSRDERYYWPIRWLKTLARLPGSQQTWLGWGHSVPTGKPVAEGADFTGMLLLSPGAYEAEAATCILPNGDAVNFYQMIPLYEEELQYKVDNDTDALLARMQEEHLKTVDCGRPNACLPRTQKEYALKPEAIRPLLEWEGPEGCLATDRITVDGCRVGYMYREQPDEGVPDSGWRFTAGDESAEYMNDPQNSGIYALNTICNCDPEVLPLLHAPYGTAYARDENGEFQEERFPADE